MSVRLSGHVEAVRGLVWVRRQLSRRRGVRLRSVQLWRVHGREQRRAPLMLAAPGMLAVVGSVCLTLALVLAWCLAGVRASSFVKRCFPSYPYLLKAHLDFLMMAGLLYIFFLLFEQLRLAPPPVVVAAMSVGSLTNPAGFLALSLKPDLSQRPTSPFGALMVLSFAVSTVGYGGAAWCVARAVVRHFHV
jgi:hypothetical protein